jgi:hypothetical protein
MIPRRRTNELPPLHTGLSLLLTESTIPDD